MIDYLDEYYRPKVCALCDPNFQIPRDTTTTAVTLEVPQSDVIARLKSLYESAPNEKVRTKRKRALPTR